MEDSGKDLRGLRLIWHWIKSHSHITLDLIAIPLSLIAILFATIQYVDSRRLIHSNEQLAEKTSDVSRKADDLINLSHTHYVGEFPNNIDRITKIIGDTCASLDIMADTPGYGIYSDHDRFVSYQNSLTDIAQHQIKMSNCLENKSLAPGLRPTVRLLVFPSNLRKQLDRSEFNKKKFLEALKNDDAAEKRMFLDFFHACSFVISPLTAEQYLVKVRDYGDYDDFNERVDRCEAKAEEEFHNKNIKVREAKTSYSFYAWIRDDEQAVFSFQYLPKGDPARETSFRTKEVSFITEDRQLVSSFREVFLQLWCQADRYDPNEIDNACPSERK